jgi:nucleoid DNA-binding protein
MVGKIIREYMEGGAKKLTVPGFGTFMRRGGGNAHGGSGYAEGEGEQIIFVDLLRGDDKTLSELVEDAGGYSEVEAMALIDRFIFEARNSLEKRGSATIDGFGTMTLDHKGVIQFRYSPSGRRPAREETVVQERLFEPVKAAPPVAKAPVVQRPAQPAQRPQQQRPPVRRVAPRPKKPAATPTDRILIIAIVAAAIALIAMIFGLTSGNSMPFLQQ